MSTFHTGFCKHHERWILAECENSHCSNLNLLDRTIIQTGKTWKKIPLQKYIELGMDMDFLLPECQLA